MLAEALVKAGALEKDAIIAITARIEAMVKAHDAPMDYAIAVGKCCSDAREVLARHR